MRLPNERKKQKTLTVLSWIAMSQDRAVGSRATSSGAGVSRRHNDMHTARRVALGTSERRGEETGSWRGDVWAAFWRTNNPYPPLLWGQKAHQEEPTDEGNRDMWRATCSWYHNSKSWAGERAWKGQGHIMASTPAPWEAQSALDGHC